MTPRVQALLQIKPFDVLGPAEAEQISEIATARRYSPGDTLFYEGEPCAGIHLVTKGTVKILKTTPAGRQIVLAMQRAPSTVAEVPVFDGGPYPATVVAQDSVEALLLHRKDFHALCRRNPDLTLSFLATFGRRLRHLVSLVELITFGGVRQRLAQTLLDFADLAGSNGFTLPETQEQMAVRLGTVREVVSRNLSRFHSEGLIRMARREVEILDREGLVAEANTEI